MRTRRPRTCCGCRSDEHAPGVTDVRPSPLAVLRAESRLSLKPSSNVAITASATPAAAAPRPGSPCAAGRTPRPRTASPSPSAAPSPARSPCARRAPRRATRPPRAARPSSSCRARAVLDRRQQVLLAERLHEVAEHARLDRARDQLVLAVRGQHHDRDRPLVQDPRARPRSRRAAASSRPGPRGRARSERASSTASSPSLRLGADLEAGALEQLAQVEPDDRLVLGDQDPHERMVCTRARVPSLGGAEIHPPPAISVSARLPTRL